MKPVDVVGLYVEATSGSPVLLLREQDAPHRVLPLLIGAPEALSIACALEGTPAPRPLTHDLLAALVESLEARIDHVEVTDQREGTFLAELTVTGRGGERRIDSRPSDAIALALRVDAPLFVNDGVLDESGAVLDKVDDADDLDDPGTGTDTEAIEEEVVRFRRFLAELDPSEFGTGPDDTP